MKKLKLSTHVFQGNALTREQLKKVMGGVGGCGTSDCNTQFPNCLISICISTGAPANICTCEANPQGC